MLSARCRPHHALEGVPASQAQNAVFLQPEGDHYRTRLTHTLEVTRLARTVGRRCGSTRSVRGHRSSATISATRRRHAGERRSTKFHGPGFRHYEQSLRVVDCIEKDGRGLNLCQETRIGILAHTKGHPEESREAVVVRLCDHVAYLNHDLDDAMRAGIVAESSCRRSS